MAVMRMHARTSGTSAAPIASRLGPVQIACGITSPERPMPCARGVRVSAAHAMAARQRQRQRGGGCGSGAATEEEDKCDGQGDGGPLRHEPIEEERERLHCSGVGQQQCDEQQVVLLDQRSHLGRIRLVLRRAVLLNHLSARGQANGRWPQGATARARSAPAVSARNNALRGIRARASCSATPCGTAGHARTTWRLAACGARAGRAPRTLRLSGSSERRPTVRPDMSPPMITHKTTAVSYTHLTLPTTPYV